MRLIRPAQRPDGRLRALPRAVTMMIVGGAAATMLAFVPSSSPTAVAVLGLAAALGLGIGGAYVMRALRHSPQRRVADELARVLASRFDDTYALVLQPRIPGVSSDLAGVLVGPGAVRALVVRDWDGRYRLRGRAWEFDGGERRGWIACRTNPSFEAARVAEALRHWAEQTDLDLHLPLAPAIVFPRRHSRVVLEEPDDEIVTTDNAPWWAQRIGSVQRLDAASVALIVNAVMAASEAPAAAVSAKQRVTVTESR